MLEVIAIWTIRIVAAVIVAICIGGAIGALAAHITMAGERQHPADEQMDEKGREKRRQQFMHARDVYVIGGKPYLSASYYMRQRRHGGFEPRAK